MISCSTNKPFFLFFVLVVLPIGLAIVWQNYLFSGLEPPPSDYGSGRMFDEIAPRYDFINRVLALSLDVSWRKRMVQEIRQSIQHIPRPQILDLATGTADVAILLAQDIPNAEILGIDPSINMLSVGRTKIQKLNLQERIHLQSLDSQSMHIHLDETFDAATMAFGIRNVPNRTKALCEIQRVLKPQAHFAILEFSEPDDNETEILPKLAKLFIRYVVPFLGGILSGKPREYWHLQNSIQDFPSPQQFAQFVTNIECENGSFQLEKLIQLNFKCVQLYVLSKTPPPPQQQQSTSEESTSSSSSTETQ